MLKGGSKDWSVWKTQNVESSHRLGNISSNIVCLHCFCHRKMLRGGSKDWNVWKMQYVHISHYFGNMLRHCLSSLFLPWKMLRGGSKD